MKKLLVTLMTTFALASMATAAIAADNDQSIDQADSYAYQRCYPGQNCYPGNPGYPGNPYPGNPGYPGNPYPGNPYPGNPGYPPHPGNGDTQRFRCYATDGYGQWDGGSGWLETAKQRALGVCYQYSGSRQCWVTSCQQNW